MSDKMQKETAAIFYLKTSSRPGTLNLHLDDSVFDGFWNPLNGKTFKAIPSAATHCQEHDEAVATILHKSSANQLAKKIAAVIDWILGSICNPVDSLAADWYPGDDLEDSHPEPEWRLEPYDVCFYFIWLL